MKQKDFTTRELKRILSDNGFKFIRCKGDHFHYVKDGKRVVVNNNINRMVCKRIIKENKLVY